MRTPSLLARATVGALCVALSSGAGAFAATIARPAHGASHPSPRTPAIRITAAERTALLEQIPSEKMSPAWHRTLGAFADIHDFAGPDGEYPQGALLQGLSGSLFGESQAGGSSSLGTVFKSHTKPGLDLVTLHSFGATKDGASPSNGMRNIFDDLDIAGYLYGVTSTGGSKGDGAVFRISAGGDEEIVHSFTGWGDGAVPAGRLLPFVDGKYYGTTSSDGDYGFGTVFQFDPHTNKLKTIYSFKGQADGGSPLAGLSIAIDGFELNGNLFGVTRTGGSLGAGTIFAISPAGAFATIYNFANVPDASAPESELVPDLAGNLYGVSSTGGSSGIGTLFKTDVDGNETIVHDFAQDVTGNGPTGGSPLAPVSVNYLTGILYGTASSGGANGLGVVFRFDPSQSASSGFSLLHEFAGADGAYPEGKLVVSRDLNLYGTTNGGGANGDGTVFGLPLQ